MTFALIGNPNCGKTTLFNALTGENQYVGNWPGVTVERREGVMKNGGKIVDLPGVYSLTPYSIEEKVAREYVFEGNPDAVINVIDATTIERGLYLTLQLLEKGIKVIIALNMMDELDKRGVKYDVPRLISGLGAPVVPISAREGRGLDELRGAMDRRLSAPPRAYLKYSAHSRDALARLDGDWEALSGDGDNAVKAEYEKRTNLAAYVALASARYEFIEKLAASSGIPRAGYAPGASDRLDRVLTGKILALPAFFAMFAAMFYMTFGFPGAFLSGLMESVVALAGSGANALLTLTRAPAWTVSLAVDGVLAGVGGVLAFLPQILILFLFISVLEDSGYMARAAYIADRPLKKLGLSGRSFIPMLMGFGCTTTAVVAARGVENERDRRMTIMLTPYMSCGAKLPIYALFAAAFLPGAPFAAALFLYVFGACAMVAVGALLRKTAFRGAPTPFIMELPDYRAPVFSAVARRLRDRARDFMTRAGSIIFLMSVVMWFFSYFTPGFKPAAGMPESMLGAFGSFIAPVFRPLGFGQAEKCVALLSGIVAKEAVVSTMRVAYSASDPGALIMSLRQAFALPDAVSFMVFTLLYTPCVSALAAMRRELGSRRLLWLSIISQLAVAYAAALLVRALAALIC